MDAEARDAAILSKLSQQQMNTVKSWVDGETPRPELVQRKGVWSSPSTKVWYGRSDRESKEAVKAMCRGPLDGPSHCDFDFERKIWGTNSLDAVPKLILSRLWVPDGIPADLVPFAAVEAWTRVEKVRMQNQEREMKAVSQSQKQQRDEQKTRIKNQEETRKRQQEVKQRMLSVPSTTAAEYAQAAKLGLAKELVDSTADFPHLGPRAGLSTWCRLRRYIDICKRNEKLSVVGKNFETVKNELLIEYERRAVGKTEKTDLENDTDAAKIQKNEENSPHVKVVYECFENYTARIRKEAQEARKAKEAKEAKDGNARTTHSNDNPVYTSYYRQREESEKRSRALSGLDTILENAAKRQIKDQKPMLLRCPECNFAPTMQQFLECRCSKNAFGWSFCVHCNVNCHFDKLPCECQRHTKAV